MRRRLALGCGALVSAASLCGGGLYLGGRALDGEVNLQTSADLAATPDQLFPVVSSFSGIKAWWQGVARAAGGPPLEVVHLGGPTSGPGMEVGFSSNGEVFERWTVLESEPPRRIVYAIDFMVFQVERTILLTDRDDATLVRWAEQGTIDSPLMRYMALLPADDTIARFQDALAALEETATASPGGRFQSGAGCGEGRRGQPLI